MTLVDVNILIYAEDSLSAHHSVVRPWWDALMSTPGGAALCWHSLNGFLRLATHPKLSAQPLSPTDACGKVRVWLNHPYARLVVPGPGYWREFERLIDATQATGNLLMDAHLAALAIEHGCELASCDADFAKFPGLRWINPLTP